MKKNFAKKLATVLSMALVVASVAPVTASAATAPDLKARRATVYEGKYYSYAATNVKGYTVKWAVSGEGAEFAELSNKTGANTYLSVETDGDLAAKNADLKLTAKFYKDGVLKQTRVDNVVIKVSATDVAINTTVDTKLVSVGDKIDFNRTLTPANSTSKTYWKVLDKDDKEIAGAIDAQGNFTVTKLGQYKVVAEVRNAKDAVLRASDEVVVVASNKVASVTPINATQVEVKFTQPVDATDAALLTQYSINNVNPTSVAVSADKKTATLTFALAASVQVTNGVVVVNPIKTVADATALTEKFTQVFSYTDTVRPTVTGVTYTDYLNAVINFSEPIASLGTVSKSNAGLVVGALSADGKTVTVGLAGVADGAYTVTLVGAYDKNNNLISPNPVVATLTKAKNDTTKPTVVAVTPKSTTALTVQFSETLKAVPTVKVGAQTGVVTQDSTDNTKYNVTLGLAVSGLQKVEVSAFSDPSDNAGDTYTNNLVTFTADTTNPAYASHELKTINNVQYLVVTYNEDVTNLVTAGAIAGTYVDANQVTKTVTDLGMESVNDTKSIKIAVPTNAAGNYTVTIPAGIVKDASGNSSDAKTISFVLGAAAADTSKPSVLSVNAQASLLVNNSNKLIVNFSAPVSAATALNVANYTVEGQNVFASAIFKENQQTVELTFVDGAITVDGTRNLTIANVAGTNGSVMNADTKQIVFEENVKPVLASAKLVDASTIQLNFTETVANLDTTDFEVYVKGVKVAVTGVDADGTITLTTPLTNLVDVVTVKILSTNNITDNGTPANKLAAVDTVTVTY